VFELVSSNFCAFIVPFSRCAVRSVKLILRMHDFGQFHVIFPSLFAIFPIFSPEAFADSFAVS
jgi:hypothetical protein